MNSKQNQNLSQFIQIGLLGAMAVVLMYLDMPLPFIPFPWLKIDLSDVPALLGGFAFGPMAAITIELLKNILILVVKGTSTGFVGEAANFLIGVVLVAPVAYAFKIKERKSNVIIGMIIGFIGVQILGAVLNIYVLLPLYNMAMTGKDALRYVTAGLIPFNGIKAILVYVVTYLLFKRIGKVVFKKKINL